ncbi:hypothetical protein [Phormidium sp. CCY1219]|nr:hypothetical protein [Phormidium sp. CCY1219]
MTGKIRTLGRVAPAVVDGRRSRVGKYLATLQVVFNGTMERQS